MFGVYSEPIEIAWRQRLSFHVAHYPIRDKSLYWRYNSKWKYLLLLKLWWCIMFFSYWDLTVNPAPLGYRRFQIGCVFAEYLFKGPTYSPIALSLLQTKLVDKTAD